MNARTRQEQSAMQERSAPMADVARCRLVFFVQCRYLDPGIVTFPALEQTVVFVSSRINETVRQRREKNDLRLGCWCWSSELSGSACSNPVPPSYLVANGKSSMKSFVYPSR